MRAAKPSLPIEQVSAPVSLETPMRRVVLASLLALALPFGALAQVVDVSGAKFQATEEVGGQKLVLNGYGIRYRAVFKVYAAALYLNQKATTPEAVFANTAPKRVELFMLRDVDGKDLGKAFTNGMEKNMLPAERMKSINGIFKFGEIFNERKKLAAGDRVGVDWVPGVGAQVSVNGKPAGEIIKEVEFYNSVLRIWLGADPADATLKKELLGEVKTTRR
jgi:hypothetical protein